jgi:hypothetical protein
MFLCQKEKEEYEKGWELTLCLGLAIVWSMGNPMPELTLTPLTLKAKLELP